MPLLLLHAVLALQGGGTSSRGAARAAAACIAAPPEAAGAAPTAASAARLRAGRYSAYEQLRGPYDRAALQRFFALRPLEFGGRLVEFTRAAIAIRDSWRRESDDTQARGVRLREQLAVLGPVAVKLGQTLSQRPDILDEEICEELKPLQTTNKPFDDAEAMRLLSEELEWRGPIAPGVCAPECAEPDGAPLFASISASPIASASLGQVYKATLHDGSEVAVKVQRPSAMRQVATDFAVLTTVLYGIQSTGWGNGDLVEITDIVAAGVFEEMDYRNEAVNAQRFERSLDFLGYVSVPAAVPSLPPTPRVLVTEWVAGRLAEMRSRHLSDLSREEGTRMTNMAVDAVTASLVLTGFVHADPHEGNIMLGDDGRLYFLDFGLMSEVRAEIMEAFAYGIQCVLNKDWRGLVTAFVQTGFVGTGPSSAALPDHSSRLEARLLRSCRHAHRERMESVPGGTSRFGALSTVLFDMGNQYTPPYIILLIRTFLTLEARDLDSTELLTTLTTSRKTRHLRRLGVRMLAESLTQRFAAALSPPPKHERPPPLDTEYRPVCSDQLRPPPEQLPVSPASEALRRRRAERLAGVRRVLVASHLQRQVRAGWRGAAAIGAVGLLFFRVAVVAFCKAAVRTLPGAVGGIRRAVLRG
ncbi:hypothetical protein EMIHUDRAFT_460118 [Emiliania huxleyi CCMP1516]|uniref:Protein kinase domain-containing protein n=2 Tax=Emiliania huxleyi TaxID=2903 RepID=A0A0D3I5C5_EMIH1|nr:hypothetical protein EMIHUDRAFT_460118 [Emiliania huxleyi CCMP1516]EOD06460.1 hypothetical protein EMIHUDRAFT_460118 [Emiliania huxleyi CCMP1516]|eukprot:XP_005758889.1 hypothetical protein EMIHUDRAFT_460118 [Emiliania huxleyi CCMP1516]